MTDPEPRRIELSVEVPGTPEEVWRAIATGPGITSWFVPHEVDERVGGTVTMDFGTMGDEMATVSGWDPPHRVELTASGDRPLVYEWLVEARDGGTCVVRLVNSGFGAGADWDEQFESMSQGWELIFESLRLHLTHFRGQDATSATPVATVPGPNRAAFGRLCAALGVADDLEAGDRFATAGDGVPELTGTVNAVQRRARMSDYAVVVERPVPGHGFVAAEGDGDEIMVSMYLYFYGDAASAQARAWDEFFASRFPRQPQPVT